MVQSKLSPIHYKNRFAPECPLPGIVFIPLLYCQWRLRRGDEIRVRPREERRNKRKHGIDFEEAQALWADSALMEVPARTSGEPRWLLIGKIGQKHWSAVVTRRDENVRLISVRRSRSEEVRIYESEDL